MDGRALGAILRTQGRVDIKALEADQAGRKARDREQGDVKIGRGQPHPSREIAPIGLGTYHEDRGRDFSKITGGDAQAGLTAAAQARAVAEDEGKAQRERQRHLPGPVR